VLTCYATDVLQTSGTAGILLWQNDRQRVAGGDCVTAWTYTIASHWGSQSDGPNFVHVSSSTLHDFHSVIEPVIMRQSEWWRVERNCRKVQSVNIFTCLNVAVCLKHEVQVSVCGCELSLSLFLYLQMYTFGRIGSLLVLQCNWYWHQHSDKSLQSAACNESEGSNVHYRFVCTLRRSWTYITFKH
jgi:hypothetical protein